MAIIKKNELKGMSVENMKSRLVELSKELVKLRAQVSRGTPAENPGKIRIIKRTIAKLLMFINQKKQQEVKQSK